MKTKVPNLHASKYFHSYFLFLLLISIASFIWAKQISDHLNTIFFIFLIVGILPVIIFLLNIIYNPKIPNRSKAVVGIFALGFFAIVSFVFHHYPANLYSSFALESLTGMVLLLVILSIYIQYKLKDELNNDQKDHGKFTFRGNEKHLHYHASYAHITIFFITIVGLIYTAYSDVFYQQSNPVSPIINGLENNNYFFDLGKIRSETDTVKLVFVLDVSGSINYSRNIDVKRAQLVIDSIAKGSNILKSSAIAKSLRSLLTNPEKSGLALAKIKISQLLAKNWSRLISSGKYSISIFSFGRYTDLDWPKTFITDSSKLEYFIEKIINIDPDPQQEGKTDIRALIEKINQFIQPDTSKGIFYRPKTVITVLSDFIDDVEKEDSLVLSKLVADFSTKSTYFNFFYFRSNNSQKYSTDFDVLPLFDRYVDGGQMHKQNIDEDLILHTANFKSGDYITFIVSKPFYVSNCRTQISAPNLHETAYLTLHRMETGSEDWQWQQFSKNGSRLTFESLDSIRLDSSDNFFEFTGHVSSQFPKNYIEFTFPNSLETVSTEIVFIKGLPNFISRIFFSSAVLIVLISIVYLFYLPYWLINRYLLQDYLFDRPAYLFNTFNSYCFRCTINGYSGNIGFFGFSNEISDKLVRTLAEKNVISSNHMSGHILVTGFPPGAKIKINVEVADILIKDLEFLIVQDNKPCIYFDRNLFDVEESYSPIRYKIRSTPS